MLGQLGQTFREMGLLGFQDIARPGVVEVRHCQVQDEYDEDEYEDDED
ncbi:hypothetical protein [Streptomyces cellostaticus]|nr:hypothetical protein [Streptomyces cellostaticus]GHI02789.1 hypothetical protein Scel_11100 [Streptomyces cellostaticus]